MAEDTKKKAAPKASGETGELINGPNSAKTASPTSSAAKSLEGALLGGGQTPGGQIDWNSDPSASQIDAGTVPILGPGGNDPLGLGGIVPHVGKKASAQQKTIGSRVQDVTDMTKDAQSTLANTLVEAGVLKSDTKGFTTSELQTAMDEALKQASQSGAKSLSDYLVGQIQQGGGTVGSTGNTPEGQTADVNALTDDMQSIADDYMLPASSQGLAAQAKEYLNAGLTATQAEANYKQAAQQQASALFGGAFATQIDSGISTKTLLDPYTSLAEKTLGVDPSTINWTSPQWQSALMSGSMDPTTKRPSVATLSQFSSKIMQDPSFGYQYTDEAQNSAGSLVASLLKLFGKVPDESLSTSSSGPTPDLAAT